MLKAVIVVRGLDAVLGLPISRRAIVSSRICTFLRMCVFRRHALYGALLSRGSKRRATNGQLDDDGAGLRV